MFSLYQLEQKIKETDFRWFLNILLIFAIFYTTKISDYLNIQKQPLAILVASPAAGFSLAAMLLFKYKPWPGIFLGCFSYNALYLCLGSHSIASSLIVATLLSLASVLQAFIGAFIIRSFASQGYFNTVKDFIVFLVPASFLTCLLTSFIGVITLYLYGMLSSQSLVSTWMTFWVENTLVVYIFTPLVVIWLTQKPQIHIIQYHLEALAIFTAFSIITTFMLFSDLPTAYLFILLNLWIAYRFRLHGVTLSIFFTALAIIIPTLLGSGTFIYFTNPFLAIAIFIEVVAAASLSFAVILNEREIAYDLLQVHSRDLQHAVEMYANELKKLVNTTVVKEKLFLLSLLGLNIVRQTLFFFKEMGILNKASVDNMHQLQATVDNQQSRMDPGVATALKNNCNIIENYLENNTLIGSHTSELLNTIYDAIHHAIQEKSLFLIDSNSLPVNINTVVEMSIHTASVEAAKRYSNFTISAVKTLDPNVHMAYALPEDLIYALSCLLLSATDSMQKKKTLQGDQYSPQFEIYTKDEADVVEIVIQDNGLGASERQLKNIFQSFFTIIIPEQYGNEPFSFNLCLAHDIILYAYHGKLTARSKEGEFMQLIIKLPKNRREKR